MKTLFMFGVFKINQDSNICISNFIATASNPWTIEIGNVGNQNSLAGLSVDATQLPCTGFSLPV